jgi:calcineurin-like phosphoesterase family protein
MSNVWFTSDTHFGHARIIELSNRPFRDVQHMNEMLVKNWNDKVAPDDHVYHLGDVALGSFADSIAYVGRLNGIKHLVVGNHDRLFIDPEVKNVEKAHKYADRFRSAYEEVFDYIEAGTFDENGVPAAAAELLFIPEIRVNLSDDTNFVSSVLRMSHFPYTGDSHDKPRYDLIRPKDDGKILLHGHTHAHEVISRSAKGTLQIHVGVDSWFGQPVSLSQILLLIKENS